MWKSVENAGIQVGVFDNKGNSEDNETEPEGIAKGKKTNTAVSHKVTNWSDKENSHSNDLSNEGYPQQKTASQRRKAKTICCKRLTVCKDEEKGNHGEDDPTSSKRSKTSSKIDSGKPKKSAVCKTLTKTEKKRIMQNIRSLNPTATLIITEVTQSLPDQLPS